MRVAHLPHALKAVYAKVLAYQPDHGEHYFCLSDGQAAFGGERKIVVTLLASNDQPVSGVTVTQEWPDGHESFESDARGQVTFFLGPGSRFMPPRGGPHRIYVGRPETLESDVVYSLGSPNGQPTAYQLTFREMVG